MGIILFASRRASPFNSVVSGKVTAAHRAVAASGAVTRKAVICIFWIFSDVESELHYEREDIVSSGSQFVRLPGS
jgi:hypothetical protein